MGKPAIWIYNFQPIVVSATKDIDIRSTKGWRPSREVFLEDMLPEFKLSRENFGGIMLGRAWTSVMDSCAGDKEQEARVPGLGSWKSSSVGRKVSLEKRHQDISVLDTVTTWLQSEGEWIHTFMGCLTSTWISCILTIVCSQLKPKFWNTGCV